MFLYSAVSNPLDRSKRFTRFALPGRPVHFDTNSASPGSILVMQQFRATNKSLTLPPLMSGTHLYSWVDWGVVKRTKMPKLRNGSKEDSNPGSLDCGSGVLPFISWSKSDQNWSLLKSPFPFDWVDIVGFFYSLLWTDLRMMIQISFCGILSVVCWGTNEYFLLADCRFSESVFSRRPFIPVTFRSLRDAIHYARQRWTSDVYPIKRNYKFVLPFERNKRASNDYSTTHGQCPHLCVSRVVIWLVTGHSRSNINGDQTHVTRTTIFSKCQINTTPD